MKQNNIKGRNWADYNNHKMKEETKKKLSLIHNDRNEKKWNEIKELYQQGHTVKQIINKLHTSPNTVIKVIKKFNLKKNYGEHS